MPEVLQEARCYYDQEMPAPLVFEFAGGLAAVYSARCPEKTTPNEDTAALIPFGERSGVLVVADGVGGITAGEQAARLAVEAVREAVEEAARQGLMLRTAILNGFERANVSVQTLAGGAATTLAVVEIDGHLMRPYHAGDSTILVVGGRGKVKLQTVCHSPVGYAVEAGMLDRIDAMQHEHRHIVSNVVGSAAMRIEIGPTVPLSARDTLLVASDGLHDNLHDAEIIARLRKGALADAMRHLAADAQARMCHHTEGEPSKPDDLTFVAFRPRPVAKS